jgi:hypothetical protein
MGAHPWCAPRWMERTDSRLVVLRSYPAKIHADLAKSALEAADIDAFVRGGDVNSARWVPGNPIELWVRPEDVERAIEILGADETFSD